MKKIIFVLCLILASSLTVLASSSMYKIGETIGHAADFDGSILHLIGEAVTYDGREDVLINIANAPIYNLQTGFRVEANTIYPGMSIRSAYVISQSEPFEALAIWLNWDFNDAAVFSVVASGNIQYGDTACIFLSEDGKYRLTISENTVIICPRRGRLSFRDISPGQEFFIWVDMITASSPAEVFPDKMVRLD